MTQQLFQQKSAKEMWLEIKEQMKETGFDEYEVTKMLYLFKHKYLYEKKLKGDKAA